MGKAGTVRLDAILITRGGGSLEDLWAFNEEVVARAVFDSQVPVVSAVGHEIDFTISDFVADLRAATPSAGAELLTEGMMRRREWVAELAAHLFTLARSGVESGRDQWEQLAGRLLRLHPRRMLNERWQRLDDLQTSLVRGTRLELRRQQVAVGNVTQRLARLKPARSITAQRQALHVLTRRLREGARQSVANHRQRWQVAETRLRLLAPEQVLARGFSITRDAETGEVLRDAKRIRAGQKIRTTLRHGELTSQVPE